ncbi:hypothetical protein [Skermania piniformis]|uniref:Head-tail adaptor protein n=1 Tax=Skermania pinensis TaxID=39122 RepID=A0ABX8SAF6_9ACTN|nr:hypothetical protein [Skermania piniformis]QXQ14845.1 hypothetical protein KV203_05540 [Skermania piniformis]
MSETVQRYRPTTGRGGVDDLDDPAPWTGPAPLRARAVEPGPPRDRAIRGRNGETIAWTVYFLPAPDLTGEDELVVRGDRCRVQILDWRSPYTTRTGLVALCTLGRG